MIAPLMFYAVVLTSGNHMQVVDTFHSRPACESASIQAWKYMQDQGMTDIAIRCVPTRHQDADAAQQDIKLQGLR